MDRYCSYSLGPVWPQHRGYGEIIDRRFVTTQDSDDAVRVASLVEEAFGSLEERRHFIYVLSREDEELEKRIRGR